MTISEAKQLVEECGLNIEHPLHEKVLNIVVKALEKQIPQKPSWVDSVPHSRCPVCHNAVATYIDSPKLPYCHWCGQALDWGETK